MPRLTPPKPIPEEAHVEARPRQTLRLALVLSVAQQYTELLITFPSIMILSRLLTPSQVGVYSLAVAFTNLVHMLRDFGTSEYLVQVPKLDDATARSAFTVTWIIAWSLAAVLFATSGYIAEFYAEPGLAWVLRILCINYLLLPVGSTVNALLIRNMQFGIRYKINLLNLLGQNGVTILLAWYGFGYYSPAWGAVAGMVLLVGGALIWAGPYRIRGVSLSAWRPVTHFGIQKTLGTVMNRLGDSAPDFVIGRALGFAEVGLFSRGFGLVRLFQDNVSGAIGSVTYSALSQRHRDGESAGALYLQSITYVTGIGWPFLGFACLFALPIIRAFFGDQWDGAVLILRLMAIQASIALIVLHYQDLLTATGKVTTATQWTTLWQLAIIVTLVAASFHGLIAIAASLIPVTLIVVGCVCIGLSRHTDISMGAYMRALSPSAVLAVFALVPAGISRIIYTPTHDSLWGPVLTAGVLWSIGFVVGNWISGHPIGIELKSWALHIGRRLGRLGDKTL